MQIWHCFTHEINGAFTLPTCIFKVGICVLAIIWSFSSVFSHIFFSFQIQFAKLMFGIKSKLKDFQPFYSIMRLLWHSFEVKDKKKTFVSLFPMATALLRNKSPIFSLFSRNTFWNECGFTFNRIWSDYWSYWKYCNKSRIPGKPHKFKLCIP